MASAECRIVSLTITEGGYYLHQGTGGFEENHPDIVRDLAHPHEPSCSFGYLAEALDRRRRRGLAPFTVMSCDNLLHNGAVARQMLLAFAERREPALRRWIEENCAFPNSMVDRITPGTTERHRENLRQNFGIDDAWPVVCEPFRQWVIEDHFPGGRPSWEQVGAQMTADVQPYEKMKIRLLNASHQAMCYIGILLGYATTDEAMADSQIARLVRALMDVEVTPLLPDVPGIDLGRYKKTLIDRFANPAIKDQLSRIAVDGSARIPKFILPSVMEQLDRGGRIDRLEFRRGQLVSLPRRDRRAGEGADHRRPARGRAPAAGPPRRAGPRTAPRVEGYLRGSARGLRGIQGRGRPRPAQPLRKRRPGESRRAHRLAFATLTPSPDPA